MKRTLLTLVAAVFAVQLSATPSFAVPVTQTRAVRTALTASEHDIVDRVTKSPVLKTGVNIGLSLTSIVANHLPQDAAGTRRLEAMVNFSAAGNSLYSAVSSPHLVFQAAYAASAIYFAGMGMRAMWPHFSLHLATKFSSSALVKKLTAGTREKYAPTVRALHAQTLAARKQLRAMAGKSDLNAHYAAMSTLKQLELSTAHVAVGNPLTAGMHAKLAARKATELSAQLAALRKKTLD